MNTPICDFLKSYVDSDAVRLHMPGHKGSDGIDKYDITEIAGADSLFEADGIIRESEENASKIFGAHTYYSTEGSSLSIRAMLYIATLYAKEIGKRPLVLAGRNAHKSFISAAALIDFDIEWLCAKNGSYLSCPVSAEDIEQRVNELSEAPSAVYLTSPDYLGSTVDITAIANVCKKHGMLLLVDNAHGAYLKFLSPSRHPIDLGADMCCDSAHKTLPSLTGSAYLHISESAPQTLSNKAKAAMSLFASTSPSYLILASLDNLNSLLDAKFEQNLTILVNKIALIKANLLEHGYTLFGDEPMKLTLSPKSYGYTGTELAELLSSNGIICEFCDPDFLVLMPSVNTTIKELDRLEEVLLNTPQRKAISTAPPALTMPKRAVSPREAALAPSECVFSKASLGRVIASVTVGCPPAVPITVSGEIIDKSAIAAFKYYGIEELNVIK